MMVTNCQFNLYNTDRAIKNNALQYDCLDYQELSDIINEDISYSFRPANYFKGLFYPFSQKLSFKQSVQRVCLWFHIR